MGDAVGAHVEACLPGNHYGGNMSERKRVSDGLVEARWAVMLVVGIGLGAPGAQALAEPQSQSTSAKSTAPLEEVIVSGYRFLDQDTSGTTNLPLPIEQVPQSISLVSSDFLRAADIKTLGEVAQYTPGALFSGAQEGYRTNIKLRGFDSGEAIDGLAIPFSLSGEYDYAVMERLEVVKGPSSVVYGTASPGGLVNFVTKQASPDVASYLSLDAGMWNQYRLEGQTGGALDADGRISAIAVAAYERGDSFMDVVNHKRTVLYGGLGFVLSDSVKAHVQAGYENNRQTSFDGIPTYEDGTIPRLPRSFFIGSSSSRFELNLDRTYVNAGLDWDINDLWQVNVKGNYTHTDSKGAAPYSGGLQPNGDLTLSIEDGVKSPSDTYTFSVASIYKLDQLGLQDSFLALSAHYAQTKGNNAERFYDAGTGNIFGGVRAIGQVYDSAPVDDFIYSGTQDDSLLTYSAQAVVKILDPLSLLLGASYANSDSKRTYSYADDFRAKYTGEVSYRGGLTYEIAPGLNAYLSYSESFQPQLYVDINEAVLPPLTGKQKELGIKYAPPGERLLLTAAAFEIVQSNKPEFDQTTPAGDVYKAVGEVRYRGAELEAVGELADRWELHAGYAYLDPVVTRNQESPELVGTKVTYLPEHTASAFVNYRLTDAFTIGGGVRYVGSVHTTLDRSTKDLPAYTIVDATAAYAWEHWKLQLNLHNLFDEKYYINNYATVYYGNVIGTPVNASISLRYDF